MRWVLRLRGGHRDPEVEREAAVDYRDAQIEGLRDALDEANLKIARLELELAKALLPEWMARTLRQRRRIGEEPTVVIRSPFTE